jgi:TolB-like protein/Flp pilus assembly protein TadD/phage shock protein PspC (stress-responsive transcriptional regulator)
MNPKNFFGELKRRNVYKVAVAYVVAGWALAQGIAQVFPVFDIPNWVVRVIVVLIVIGFPIALVLAWAFELTPEGLKRTEAADAAKQHSRNRVWIYVVIIAGALSVGLFFLGRYTALNVANLPAKSIAVLPFENLSSDPDNAYFTEGIQDEILARLAKIADLKVISRASTQRYKSSPDDLPQIAKRLGVANILEGSVQKTADRVRVTVQLINAATDAHLWGETYDRNLTDVFAAESDIARAIATTLQAKLTGSEQHALTARPTENTEAHQLYLRGRYFWNKRTGADLKKSIDYFNQAIGKDPNYALAYAGLADAYVLLSAYAEASPKDSLPQAKAAAEKALELDSTLGEAHATLGNTLVAYDLNFAEANREFRRAIELNPNYATAHQWYGETGLVPLGQFDEAIAEAKRALELDPLSVIINADVGTILTNARRYDEAIEQLRKTVEMEPGFYYAHWTLGDALELTGRNEEAMAEYKKAIALDDDPLPRALLGHLYAKLGRKDEALAILKQLRERRESSKQRYVSPFNLVLIHIGLGQKNEAIQLLEETYEERDGYNIAFIKVEPMLDPLRGDPRFEALVQKVFAGTR